MEKAKKSINLWPYFVVGSIVAIFFACVHTVVLALNNPVEFDLSYLQKKDKVDSNINEIMANDKAFNEKFSVVLPIEQSNGQTKIVNANEEFYLPVKITSDEPITDAKIELLITRPETNVLNQEPKFHALEDDIFLFGPIVLPQVGRWQIMTKINIEQNEGYPRFEIFAR